MREKKQKIVITFLTTDHAMAVESLSKIKRFPGRMIPVPSEIQHGCGLCWCCLPQERKEVEDILRDFSLPIGSIHEIMLYESNR